MEFDQLRGFYHVARLRSFTEAASKLYLSQPAISLQVKALEKELGEKLFERVGRRIQLTLAGETLQSMVEDVVGKLDEIRAVIGELHQLERGRFALGTSDTTSLYFIPDLIKQFRQDHPNIEIQITNRISQEIIRRVVDREIDLGIVSLPLEEPRLEVVPLLKYRLACVVGTSHRLAGHKQLHPRDLDGETMVTLEKSSTTQKCIERFLLGHRVQPKNAIESSNFEIIKKFVSIGLGVAIIPECVARNPVGDLHVLRFSRNPPSIELGAIFLRDRFLPHSARAFLKLMETHFRKRNGQPKNGISPARTGKTR